MFPFTKYDLNNFFAQVIRISAESLGISDTNWKTGVELLDEINKTNPTAGMHLREFMEAYSDWYDFNFDNNGVGIKKNQDDVQKSQPLERARDAARDKLRTTLSI